MTIDDLLINLLDFEPIINESELLDDVERKQFSFKDLEGQLQRPRFSNLRNFRHFLWVIPNLAIFGIAIWLRRRLRRAPDSAIAKQIEIEVKANNHATKMFGSAVNVTIQF